MTDGVRVICPVIRTSALANAVSGNRYNWDCGIKRLIAYKTGEHQVFPDMQILDFNNLFRYLYIIKIHTIVSELYIGKKQ